MKKILFIFSFSFLVFHSKAQNPQYYKWKGFNPGIFCNDTTMQDCAVLNFEADTLRDMLWIFGQFQGIGNINCPYIVGYQDGQFITIPDTFSGWGDSNDYLFYQGNLVGCLQGGVWSYDMNTHQFTTIGIFPSSIYTGGMCLAEYHGNLYVGGQFYSIKGPTGGWISAAGVAKWDGTSWSALGGGLDGAGPPYVTDMVVYQNKLIIGGENFLLSGVNDGWNIVQWNDTTLSDMCSGAQGVGPGTNKLGGNHWASTVRDMEVFQDKLYIIGGFDSICGIPGHMAYWDGMNWTGTSYQYMTEYFFKSFLDNLIIFTAYDGPHLDWWKNDQSYFGSQINNGGIKAMETFHDTLFAGGVFYDSNSDSIPTFRLARLVYDSTGTGIGINQLTFNSEQITVYPNPVDEKLFIYRISNNNQASIQLFNYTGQMVYENANFKYASIDTRQLSNGIYFLRYSTDNYFSSAKFVVQH